MYSTMVIRFGEELLGRGLYIATRAVDDKPGTHYAILDIGNVLARPGVFAPVLYELRPRLGLTVTTDLSRLKTARRIADESGAISRFEQGVADQDYRLFTNNCEHFARFVAYGDRSSSQAFWLGAAGTIAAVAFLASLSDG